MASSSMTFSGRMCDDVVYAHARHKRLPHSSPARPREEIFQNDVAMVSSTEQRGAHTRRHAGSVVPDGMAVLDAHITGPSNHARMGKSMRKAAPAPTKDHVLPDDIAMMEGRQADLARQHQRRIDNHFNPGWNSQGQQQHVAKAPWNADDAKVHSRHRIHGAVAKSMLNASTAGLLRIDAAGQQSGQQPGAHSRRVYRQPQHDTRPYAGYVQANQAGTLQPVAHHVNTPWETNLATEYQSPHQRQPKQQWGQDIEQHWGALGQPGRQNMRFTGA